METGLRAQELERGAHTLLERDLREGSAELGRATHLLGTEFKLFETRHQVPIIGLGGRGGRSGESRTAGTGQCGLLMNPSPNVHSASY